MGAAVAASLAALDALVVEPRLIVTVSRMALPPGPGGGLARALSGARVVHLSDLHVRGWGIRERRVSRLLAENPPDLLLMTGDFGDGAEGMEALGRLLSEVRPRLGKFAVPGNNDYFGGRSAEILGTLEGAGVTVLVNGSRRIEGPGGPLIIAGVDDPHYGRDDLAAAMAGPGEEPELPVILLAHSPDLLARRARGLVVNAGDAGGPWGRGWWWQDGAHVRPDPGTVIFPSTGRRRVRIQSREDGVAFGEMRLVPDETTGRRGARDAAPPEGVAGTIVVAAGQVRDEDLHGRWSRRDGDGALVDRPDRGRNQTFPEVDPDSYFEAEFEAVGGIAYRVWVRLESGNDRGTSDSLYVQFTDSLGPEGRPDYRIGEASPAVPAGRVSLMLAGHTHGGQVRLPWIGAIQASVWSGPWQQGLYDVEGMPLYVSRGVGWSYLPVRFFCPPEVVVFETGGAAGRRDG